MTPTLGQAREILADALTLVPGYTIRPHPTPATPKPGDGWVTVGRITPSGIRRWLVVLTAVVILGADNAAEGRLDTDATALLDAATRAELRMAEVAGEPLSIVTTGASAALSALTITLTTEVQQ